MISTSSSSNDRITDCAPVTCSGATRFDWTAGVFAAGFAAPGTPLAASCDSGLAAGACGLVGALTVSS